MGGGGKGGGKGGGSYTVTPNPYEEQLAAMGKQLFVETGPQRRALYPQFTSVLEGTWRPETSPMYSPLFATAKLGVEQQYQNAMENLLGGAPSGGGLTRAMGQLETSRAKQAGSLPATIGGGLIEDMINKAYGTAFGMPQEAMQGLSTAAATLSSRQGQAMAAQAAGKGGKGSMFGGLGQGLGFLGGSIIPGFLNKQSTTPAGNVSMSSNPGFRTIGGTGTIPYTSSW